MLSKVSKVWVTPDAEGLLTQMARVSNVNAPVGETSAKLIKYLIKHQHWSPFEMVNLCVAIETPRDIARQILRHRSFSFQEFSQRYAAVQDFAVRECRMQDVNNRQNSLIPTDSNVISSWNVLQTVASDTAIASYTKALELGIAKEVARTLLPEGLTMSKMYMNGTLRSWIHYCSIRTGLETQKEHREVAIAINALLSELFPNVREALNERD